jgi:hypothetical protein
VSDSERYTRYREGGENQICLHLYSLYLLFTRITGIFKIVNYLRFQLMHVGVELLGISFPAVPDMIINRLRDLMVTGCVKHPAFPGIVSVIQYCVTPADPKKLEQLKSGQSFIK